MTDNSQSNIQSEVNMNKINRQTKSDDKTIPSSESMHAFFLDSAAVLHKHLYAV